MNTEKLKVIAEGMGYKKFIIQETRCLVETGKKLVKGDKVFPETYIYSPLTNAEQCMEIMDKLKLDVCYWNETENWSAEKCELGVSTIGYEGKTINEAVCNAAYEYFKK